MAQQLLTDAEIHDLISGNPFTLGLSIARLKDFIRQVEKAVVTKQKAEQKPIGYLHANGISFLSSKRTTAEQARSEDYNTLLYAHPMPSSCQAILDSSIPDKNDLPPLPSPFCKAPNGINYFDSYSKDQMIKYAKSAIDHHRTVKNLTTDPTHITKLSLSVDTKEVQALLQSYLDSLKGWQLVPKEPSRDMLKKMFYEIFGMDGIEEECLAARYRNMLSSFPKYTGVIND